jgi:uncharacterized membrane protein YeaQ/YmgE (transglycosylase-associated protein family)
MTLILVIIIGGIIGWLASLIMGSNQSLLLNIVVGIIGALLGGFLFGRDIIGGDFSLPALLASLVGAVILLALVSLFTRSRGRRV